MSSGLRLRAAVDASASTESWGVITRCYHGVCECGGVKRRDVGQYEWRGEAGKETEEPWTHQQEDVHQ